MRMLNSLILKIEGALALIPPVLDMMIWYAPAFYSKKQGPCRNLLFTGVMEPPFKSFYFFLYFSLYKLKLRSTSSNDCLNHFRLPTQSAARGSHASFIWYPRGYQTTSATALLATKLHPHFRYLFKAIL